MLLLLNENEDRSFKFQNLSSYNINKANGKVLKKISVQVLFHWNDLKDAFFVIIV